MFKISSDTRSKDMCDGIAKHLGLHTSEGFSIFVEIGGVVFSIPKEDVFLDTVYHHTEHLKQLCLTKDGE